MAGLNTSIAPGKPEDISSVVLFAAGNESKFMNGANIVVDGGVSCN